ncbi:Rossmann-like domain-containing protein [Clostridium sp.]|uniref:Rossmann-like domain-containing protein n=1 Tax=Clostridium sp. TaxID=1506 RepID=UPI003D6D5F42
MTKKELFDKLKNYMYELLKESGLEEESICIVAKGLSPEEAIGITERKDYPLLTGKEVMLSAEFDGAKGQAFTSAPCEYKGSIKKILESDLLENEYGRGLFIAALNAVAMRLGKADKTIHCRNDGPEKCAKNSLDYLSENYNVDNIALIGFQPAILASISKKFNIRVLDLNPLNIDQIKSGCKIEDGVKAYKEVIEWADLILCTGSTVCNGSIVDYLDIGKEVIFFGTTLAGAAPCLGVKRICFTEELS